jgi:cell division septation protein DedD
MRDYEEKSYYEIQLDNKQLILVFLAAVTVCVLIFVLGVMIGKGQKETEIAAASRTEKNVAAAEPDSNTPSQPLSDIASEARNEKKNSTEKETRNKPSPSEKDAEAATSATPVSNKKSSQYAYEDLDKKEPTEEKKQVESVPVTKHVESAPVADPVSEKPENTTAAVEDNVPKSSGGTQYTVQIMATSSRPKAEQQISTLKSRGYQPFLDESKNGEVSVFKVRVGRFADTQEAKAMAAKIKKDLRLETWVAVLD